MVLNKYLKTDSQVVVIGKKVDVVGTPVLLAIEELLKKEPALTWKFSFEVSSMTNATIGFIGGTISGASKAIKDDTEIVIMLNEVTLLSSKLQVVLLNSIRLWVEDPNVSIICTGEESAILDMFKSLEDTKHFSLEKYSGGDFVLLDESGDTVTIESCIP